MVIKIPGDEAALKKYIASLVDEYVKKYVQKYIKGHLEGSYMSFLSQNIHKINDDLLRLIEIRGNLDGRTNSKAKEVAYFK